jgi:gluconolactonase
VNPDVKLKGLLTQMKNMKGLLVLAVAILVVGCSQAPVWMRYDMAADGTVSNGKVFADATAEKEDGLPDGMKVDSQGDVYGSGPGGVWVFSPDGKHLGTIKPPETPANCGWAEDGKTLYIIARTSVYRIKLAVAGEKALYQ